MTQTVTDYVTVRRLRVPAARRGITRLEVILPDNRPSRIAARFNQALRLSGYCRLGARIAGMVCLGLALGGDGGFLGGPPRQFLYGLLVLGGLGLTHGIIWAWQGVLWWRVLRQLERQFDRRKRSRRGSRASLRSSLEATPSGTPIPGNR
ncbi:MULTISPECIES: hypothetical protein [unclassified Meiothermus]|uniref:hypothetical protein n=1 Tax=unclassified Meiothermus TaxID=370471 RepID=UPI001021856D|nr:MULTISPECIES: hypothetical protein [unclassified Meiothermus]